MTGFALVRKRPLLARGLSLCLCVAYIHLLDKASIARARAQIGAMKARGTTDLAGGLKAGLSEVVQGFQANGINRIVLLGDLVDRGPDSAGVIDTAMAMRGQGRTVHYLMGNHEEVFLKACRERDTKTLRFFLKIGGDKK